jgi:hypothetical protein
MVLAKSDHIVVRSLSPTIILRRVRPPPRCQSSVWTLNQLQPTINQFIPGRRYVATPWSRMMNLKRPSIPSATNMSPATASSSHRVHYNTNIYLVRPQRGLSCTGQRPEGGAAFIPIARGSAWAHGACPLGASSSMNTLHPSPWHGLT